MLEATGRGSPAAGSLPLDTQQECGGNPPDPRSAVIEVSVGKAVGISCFTQKKKKRKDYVCVGANKKKQKASHQ